MNNKLSKTIRREARKNAPAVTAKVLANLNNAPLRIRLAFALAVLFRRVTC